MKKILNKLVYITLRSFLLIMCLFAYCSYSVDFSLADTIKTGVISSEEVWTKVMSPIIVQDLVIQSNGKVVVNPGVKIILEGNNQSALLVQGKFILSGSKEMPIVLEGDPEQSYIIEFHSNFDFDHMSSLSNVLVRGGVRLLIEQSNVGMNSMDFEVTDMPIYSTKSVVFVNGIKVSSTSPEIYIKDSFFRMQNANILGAGLGTGINIVGSDFSISSSTIRNRRTGIKLEKSNIDIYGSHISNNNTAIHIARHVNPFPAMNSNKNGLTGVIFNNYNTQNSIGEQGEVSDTGGIGNVFDNTFNILKSVGVHENSRVRISQSAFVGNGTHILNEDNGVLDSSLNKWSISTDYTNPLSTKYGKYLISMPVLTEANSNIVFVPGIQGSRLYAHLPGDKDRQAWEPYLASGFESLSLRQPPENTSITVGDIIESAYHTYPIYKPLMDFLRSKVSVRMVKNFIPYSYDWRHLTGPNIEDAGVEAGLASAIYNAAIASPTGKVSIIAHSYGGLVAKNLLRDFSNNGIGYFIDKVLLVASPELGTPQALASLFSGYGQEILNGLIFSEAEAKKLAESIPSPYGLLPLGRYPFNAGAPIVEIVDGARKYLGLEFPEYEKSFFQRNNHASATSSVIKNTTNFKDFLMKIAEGIPNSLFGDISSNYISNAFGAHEYLDKPDLEQAFAGKILRIVGTGLPTNFGIIYDEVYRCHIIELGAEGCRDELVVLNRSSSRGDGTVLDIAHAEDANTVKLDLALDRENSHRNLSHARIFDSPTLEKYLNIWLTHNTEDARSIITSTNIAGAKEGRQNSKDGRKNDRVKVVAQNEDNLPKGVFQEVGLLDGKNKKVLQRAVMLKISNEGKSLLKVCLYNNKCTGIDSSTKLPSGNYKTNNSNDTDVKGLLAKDGKAVEVKDGYNKFSDIPANLTVEGFAKNGIIVYDNDISGAKYSIGDGGSSLVMLIEKEKIEDYVNKRSKYDVGISHYKVILTGKDVDLDKISISLLDDDGNYLKSLFYRDIVTSPKLRAEAEITVTNLVDGSLNNELKIIGTDLKLDSNGDGVFEGSVPASENGFSKYDPRSPDYVYKDKKKLK